MTKSYAYDAFGVEQDIDNNDVNPWRYCGEYFDRETGTIYLRARYYAPRTGRFTSEDPIRDGLNYYTYCSGNPVTFVDPLGLEYVVVSGSEYDSETRYKYNFIETTIKQLREFIDKANGKETVTWIVSATGYSEKSLYDMRQVADYYGVNFVTIDNVDELYNYLNSKDKSLSVLSDDRKSDTVTHFSVFSHGLTGKVSLGYNQDVNVRQLEMTKENISAVNGGAFSESVLSMFYSCNTGTGMERSFAQAWANITGGSATAVVDGQTTYKGINVGESVWDKLNRRVHGFNPYGSRYLPKASAGVKWHTFTRQAPIN